MDTPQMTEEEEILFIACVQRRQGGESAEEICRSLRDKVPFDLLIEVAYHLGFIEGSERTKQDVRDLLEEL